MKGMATIPVWAAGLGEPAIRDGEVFALVRLTSESGAIRRDVEGEVCRFQYQGRTDGEHALLSLTFKVRDG